MATTTNGWTAPFICPPAYRDRADVTDDGYATYPTPTGTLLICLGCGNLVGDRDIHEFACAERNPR